MRQQNSESNQVIDGQNCLVLLLRMKIDDHLRQYMPLTASIRHVQHNFN